MSATLLVLAVARSVGYVGAGVFRLEDAMLIAASFLPVAIGTVIGDKLHDRLDPVVFRRAVGVLLIASGAGLLLIH